MAALQLLGMGRLEVLHEGPCEAGIGQRRGCRDRVMAPHPAAGSHLPSEGTAPPCAVAPFRVVAPCPAPQKPHTPPCPTAGFRMIGRITGLLLEKLPPLVLVDVQGVGYEIDVPMSTFYNLPGIGAQITLHTHLVVREDVHLLFGFGTEPERQAFRQLVKISGVGARTALALLSGLSVADLHQAISAQDPGRLIKIPGIE